MINVWTLRPCGQHLLLSERKRVISVSAACFLSECVVQSWVNTLLLYCPTSEELHIVITRLRNGLEYCNCKGIM